MPIAIDIQDVSKRYVVPHEQHGPGYHTLRESLASLARWPMRWISPEKSGARELFWALRHITFEVEEGDVVGIIGRNGAGKSTLLKILSRITRPTSGRVLLRGRVGSLLEVGTGFHPELTGRENLYLSGSILGLTRREIASRFDQIVAFAEIERFLDMPVKRYSSGMYVRLAFAVAAHLEPAVLIVDEVLAVGDSMFQRRCLERMRTISRSGTTVLFVSHNLASVTNLCRRAVLLEAGQATACGEAGEVVKTYLARSQRSANTGDSGGAACVAAAPRPGWARPYIRSARMVDDEGAEISSIPLGGSFIVEMRYACQTLRPVSSPVMGIVINHATMGPIGTVNTRMCGFDPLADGQEAVYRCRLEAPPLLQGQYTIDLWFGDGDDNLDLVSGGLTLDVEPTDIYGTGRPPLPLGAMFFQATWEHETRGKATELTSKRESFP